MLNISIEKQVSWVGRTSISIQTDHKSALMYYHFRPSSEEQNEIKYEKRYSFARYEKIAALFESVDFSKVFNENRHQIGLDGWRINCSISSGFTRNTIDVWCPEKSEEKPETTKLLEACETMFGLVGEKLPNINENFTVNENLNTGDYMSRCFYFKAENLLGNESSALTFIKNAISDKLSKSYDVRFVAFENEFGGRFWIEGESSRGIEIFCDDVEFTIKANVLSNKADYVLCANLIDAMGSFLKETAHDEEDEIVNPSEYFSNERIFNFMLSDCKAISALLDRKIEIIGVVRSVYFTNRFKSKVEASKNEEDLIKTFYSVIHHVQWELPDYENPSAAMVSRIKGPGEAKIRIICNDGNYILNDYEYLIIGDKSNENEAILITNDDLRQIISTLSLPWEFADDFTVVAHKLNSKDWKQFVAEARKHNLIEEL